MDMLLAGFVVKATLLEWEYIWKYLEEERIINDQEDQQANIVLYEPKLNTIIVICIGIGMFPLGVVFLLLGKGQIPATMASSVVIGASIFLLSDCWRLAHTPTLIIDTKGIHNLKSLIRAELLWEEIDALYRVNTRTSVLFAVDLSPSGLVSFFARQDKRIPQRLDITTPQLALSITQSNLPLSVELLLAQIREKFADQIERYHITVECD